MPSHDPKTRNLSGALAQVDYRENASGSLEYLDVLNIESHNLTSSDKPLAEPDSEAGQRSAVYRAREEPLHSILVDTVVLLEGQEGQWRVVEGLGLQTRAVDISESTPVDLHIFFLSELLSTSLEL